MMRSCASTDAFFPSVISFPFSIGNKRDKIPILPIRENPCVGRSLKIVLNFAFLMVRKLTSFFMLTLFAHWRKNDWIKRY